MNVSGASASDVVRRGPRKSSKPQSNRASQGDRSDLAIILRPVSGNGGDSSRPFSGKSAHAAFKRRIQPDRTAARLEAADSRAIARNVRREQAAEAARSRAQWRWPLIKIIDTEGRAHLAGRRVARLTYCHDLIRRLRVSTSPHHPTDGRSGMARRDRAGRRGIFYRHRYLSARNTRQGGVADLAIYMLEGQYWADERSPAWRSNIGQTPDQVVAAFDVMEACNRAAQSNAKLAHHVIIALPHDLPRDMMLEALNQFATDRFGARNLPWLALMHAPDPEGDQRNWHGHILYATRPMRQIGPAEWEVSPQLELSVDGPDGCTGNREAWAQTLTRTCQAIGYDRTYTSLSNIARGLPPAQRHLGPGLTAAKRRGERVDLSAINQETVDRTIAYERRTATIITTDVAPIIRSESHLDQLRHPRLPMPPRVVDLTTDFAAHSVSTSPADHQVRSQGDAAHDRAGQHRSRSLQRPPAWRPIDLPSVDDRPWNLPEPHAVRPTVDAVAPVPKWEPISAVVEASHVAQPSASSPSAAMIWCSPPPSWIELKPEIIASPKDTTAWRPAQLSPPPPVWTPRGTAIMTVKLLNAAVGGSPPSLPVPPSWDPVAVSALTPSRALANRRTMPRPQHPPVWPAAFEVELQSPLSRRAPHIPRHPGPAMPNVSPPAWSASFNVSVDRATRKTTAPRPAAISPLRDIRALPPPPALAGLVVEPAQTLSASPAGATSPPPISSLRPPPDWDTIDGSFPRGPSSSATLRAPPPLQPGLRTPPPSIPDFWPLRTRTTSRAIHGTPKSAVALCPCPNWPRDIAASVIRREAMVQEDALAATMRRQFSDFVQQTRIKDEREKAEREREAATRELEAARRRAELQWAQEAEQLLSGSFLQGREGSDTAAIDPLAKSRSMGDVPTPIANEPAQPVVVPPVPSVPVAVDAKPSMTGHEVRSRPSNLSSDAGGPSMQAAQEKPAASHAKHHHDATQRSETPVAGDATSRAGVTASHSHEQSRSPQTNLPEVSAPPKLASERLSGGASEWTRHRLKNYFDFAYDGSVLISAQGEYLGEEGGEIYRQDYGVAHDLYTEVGQQLAKAAFERQNHEIDRLVDIARRDRTAWTFDGDMWWHRDHGYDNEAGRLSRWARHTEVQADLAKVLGETEPSIAHEAWLQQQLVMQRDEKTLPDAILSRLHARGPGMPLPQPGHRPDMAITPANPPRRSSAMQAAWQAMTRGQAR